MCIYVYVCACMYIYMCVYIYIYAVESQHSAVNHFRVIDRC